MTRLKLVVLGVGAFLAWSGYQEWKLGSNASETPHVIACAELEASGPGDNVHVVLSDFLLSEQAFVYEARENSTRWDKVWIPAVPLGGEYHQQLLRFVDDEGMFVTDDLPLPKSFRIIVKSPRIHTEQELAAVADADTLQGLIVNEVESLGSEERRLLAESYPGIDLDNVYILEHGRQPSSKGKSFGFLGSGALLLMFGVASFVNRS
jgi:hypothetical protein